MKPKSLYMLTDDIKDTVSEVKHMGNFLLKMGKEWEKARSKHYKTMPETLLRMLDELTNNLVCEEDGCRELVHQQDNGSWDFCFEHGHPRHKWVEGKCYCGAVKP